MVSLSAVCYQTVARNGRRSENVFIGYTPCSKNVICKPKKKMYVNEIYEEKGKYSEFHDAGAARYAL
jgi:hypothetical protein